MSRVEWITDGEIQDLIDDRLDRPAREALCARLSASPRRRAEFAALRRQQEALQRLGEEVLDEPVPARLRRILQPNAGADRDSLPIRQLRQLGLTAPTALMLASRLVM